MIRARIAKPSERLEFRDPERVQAFRQALDRLCRDLPEPISIMHVCGTHEQSIARFGLRSLLPPNLRVIMGPGCPVCVTDMPEVVFFATGFETTAVATAAVILSSPPKNFSVLSAQKYVPPAMEIVAEMPQTRVRGFLAAGHAATITGWKIFERFVERHGIPVVVAGFEPLDILSALVQLVELIRRGEKRVVNAYPRCVTPEGNRNAQRLLWEVFETESGVWRGIAYVPNGNLRLRRKYAWVDARARFEIRLSEWLGDTPPRLTQECLCGNIMAGIATPYDCRLFGKECTPENPVGACMVSSEGACRIWYEYGGHITGPKGMRELEGTDLT
jgi:hydrogenase expression/formation protein HypD